MLAIFVSTVHFGARFLVYRTVFGLSFYALIVGLMESNFDRVRDSYDARPSPRGDRVHGGDTPLAVVGERRARVVTVDLAGEPVAVEDRFRDHPRGQTVANPVHAFDAGRP